MYVTSLTKFSQRMKDNWIPRVTKYYHVSTEFGALPVFLWLRNFMKLYCFLPAFSINLEQPAIGGCNIIACRRRTWEGGSLLICSCHHLVTHNWWVQPNVHLKQTLSHCYFNILGNSRGFGDIFSRNIGEKHVPGEFTCKTSNPWEKPSSWFTYYA